MAVSQEMMKGTIMPILLKLLSERAMYGYEIIQTVHERTDHALEWKEGTVYPWLHRLEAQGLIASAWQSAPNSRRRKYYSLTRKGVTAMQREVGELETLTRAVTAILCEPVPA
jgi:DNA-binding PadR family transcriptional regulator